MADQHKSWVTQRMVNRLPPWSDARRKGYSNLQQFLNPAGAAIENLYKYIADESNNHFLPTANLDQLDISYTVELPFNFTFGRDINNPLQELFIPPRVTTVIDGIETDIQIAEGNTVEGFSYTALPTRVVNQNTYATVASVLDETELIDLDTASISSLPEDQEGNTISNRLVVTINGCMEFVNINRRTASSFVVIEGITSRGLEETEYIYINYNGVFLTRKIWKKITKVQYYGLTPDTGTIRIDPFYFNKDREVDRYALEVTDATEKLLYHKLSSKSYGSTHQHLTVTANTLAALYRGEDMLEVVREMELGYDANGTFTNITLNDIAIQPFTNRFFGIDDTHLYVFDATSDRINCQGLRPRTAGALMTISTDFTDYVRGDTVSFEPQWRRPIKRIYKNRWTIEKPDGEKKYLDIDGAELEVGSEQVGWIYNKTYTEMVFGPFDYIQGEINRQRFTYMLTQRGVYKIYLEVDYIDGTRETDIMPIQVHYKEALARITLPSALQNSTGLAFDADQKLWLLKNGSSNIAYLVHLAVDNMLIDFKKKTIYFREDYPSVKIYPSSDWVD